MNAAEAWRNMKYRELQDAKRELQNAAKKFGAVANSRNSRGDVVGLGIKLEDAAHQLCRAEKNFVEADQALQADVARRAGGLCREAG